MGTSVILLLSVGVMVFIYLNSTINVGDRVVVIQTKKIELLGNVDPDEIIGVKFIVTEKLGYNKYRIRRELVYPGVVLDAIVHKANIIKLNF